MSSRRLNSPTVLHRIRCVGTVILGVNCLGAFVIAPTQIRVFASLTAPWWVWVAGLTVVTVSIALITVGLRQRTDLLDRVSFGSALGYTAVIVLWFLGWNGATSPGSPADGLELWVILLPQIIACVFVIAGRLASAIATVIVTGALSLAMTVVASGQGAWIDLAPAAWLLAMTSLYLVIAWSVLAAARRYDNQRVSAAAEAVRRLHDGAHGSEQRRLDAMVHDRLIAILLALRPGPLRPADAKAITAVLDEIADWRSDEGPGPIRVPATELAHRLRLSVDEIDDSVEMKIDAEAHSDYPAEAVDAIVDAVGEAVRNFHRHAGPDARCAVLCEARTDEIAAVVVDDGAGFEPAAVPANRIGVALGIIERMRVLDGGDGRIDSRRGVGTRVELSWAASGGAR